MRTLLLFLHIAAAGAWLGASFSQFVLARRFRSADPRANAEYQRGAVALGARLYTPAAIVSLFTGVLLVTNNASFDFNDAFVSMGFFTVIAGAAMGMAIFGPKGQEAAAKLEMGDEAGAMTALGRIQAFGMLDVTLVLLTMLAMVAKWGAG